MGLSLSRRVTPRPPVPVPVAPVTGTDRSSSPVVFIGPPSPAPMPVGANTGLSDPQAPSTSEPLTKVAENPRDRFRRLTGGALSLGSALPILGKPISVGGVVGGVAFQLTPSRLGDAKQKVIAGDVQTQKQVFARMDQARAVGFRGAARRFPVLANTPTGIDFQKGIKIQPNRPAGMKEALSPLRPLRIRGSIGADLRVPAAVRDRLADQAATLGGQLIDSRIKGFTLDPNRRIETPGPVEEAIRREANASGTVTVPGRTMAPRLRTVDMGDAAESQNKQTAGNAVIFAVIAAVGVFAISRVLK